jgi:hypothetical protein
MQSSPASCHFLLLRSRYSPQHPVCTLITISNTWQYPKITHFYVLSKRMQCQS